MKIRTYVSKIKERYKLMIFADRIRDVFIRDC